MDFHSLQQQITNNPTLNDIELLDELNAKNIEQTQDIQTADIANYLNVTQKILAITDSTDDVARLVIHALNTFQSFDMSNPVVQYALNNRLTYLVSISLINQDDADYILLLGIKHISRANQLGFNQITQGDIDAARAL